MGLIVDFYSLKIQIIPEKTMGKLWKNIRKKAKSFPIVLPVTMGKLFRGFGPFFGCFLGRIYDRFMVPKVPKVPWCPWCPFLHQKL